jgi:hypothetical protein
MGCGNSRDESAQPARGASISQGQGQGQNTAIRTVGSPIMVPPTYQDANSRPIHHQDFELNRDAITQALDHIGQYLDKRGVAITAITVGGAVNTVYLQSRHSTDDVDFFIATPYAAEYTLFHEAALSAARSIWTQQRELGANWFNNDTQLRMSRDILARLAQHAVQQNVVVHQYRGSRGGIVVYAAPWDYAFCDKLNRLCETNARTHDITDAVSYLHQYLQKTGSSSVSAEETKGWCRIFRKNVTDNVLDRVNAQYIQTYGIRPIMRL